MLNPRPCTSDDGNFVYQLMKEHMKEYFDRNTAEKWSDDKFWGGFKPERITILEKRGLAVGFNDLEAVYGKENYLYLHNVHVQSSSRGDIFTIDRMLNEEALKRGLHLIRGKIFKDNTRTIELEIALGAYVVLDPELEKENSVWIEKRV
jgi:hypothetical protein